MVFYLLKNRYGAFESNCRFCYKVRRGEEHYLSITSRAKWVCLFLGEVFLSQLGNLKKRWEKQTLPTPLIFLTSFFSLRRYEIHLARQGWSQPTPVPI